MLNANPLISCTSHIHDYEPDFQDEKQQIDLLGDIGINILAPALIPSPSLLTPRPVCLGCYRS